MLNTTVYSLEEGFLGAGVDEPIGHHVVCHPVRLDLVERLAQAAGKGQRTKVGRIICASSLVAENNPGGGPSLWGQAGL